MVGTTNNLFGKRGDDTFTVERSGKIMRQAGPPLASAGHVGNIALDVSAATYDVWQKTRPWSGTSLASIDYQPRGVTNDAAATSQVSSGSAETSPWSRIATLPNTAASAMAVKWYGDARFPNTLGAVGDYALYLDGATVREWGPKVSTGWPENGEGGALTQSVITRLTPRGASATGRQRAALDVSTLSSSVVLRGLFGDIASTLGIVTSTIQQRGLETTGHAFPGTITPPAVNLVDQNTAATASTAATNAASSATDATNAANTAAAQATSAGNAVTNLTATVSALVAGGVTASPLWLDGFDPTVVFTPPKGAARLNGAYSADTAILTVSSAAKRVVGPTGTLDTAAANTLAYDYAGGMKELVVEKAATKYGPYSEAVGVTGYGLANITSPGSSLGPDGTAGMREWVENTAAGAAHNWWVATGLPTAAAAGEFWAHQIIVRRGVGARNIKMKDIGSAFTGAYPEVGVNLATGAVLFQSNCGRAAVVAMTIPGVGACWRIEWTATTTQAGVVATSACPLSGTTSGTDFYPGDGVSSIHYGYLNVEKVAAAAEPPSSYVSAPGTAAVNRIADDVRFSAAVLAQQALANGATIVVRGSSTYVGSGRIVGYQNAAGSPLIMANSGSTNAAAYDGATAITATAASGGWGSFGVVEAHAPGVTRLAFNGGAVVNSAAFTATYRAPTLARLGAAGDGGNAVNLRVREIVIWPLVGSVAAVQGQARVYA